jgi:hypothetical protein
MTRAALVLLLLAGCGRTETSVRLSTSFSGEATQLRFAGSGPGFSFGPTTRPDHPGALLASPQSLTVLLPDRLDGQVLSLTVEALSGDALVASGGATAIVRANQLVEVSATLRPLTVTVPDAGTPDAGAHDGGSGCGTGPACGLGERCVNGLCTCDPATCPGCCGANGCEPGTDNSACGIRGATCSACATGDGCSGGARGAG